jgi:KDO2-lipid IV(A) lauroyltransferase
LSNETEDDRRLKKISYSIEKMLDVPRGAAGRIALACESRRAGLQKLSAGGNASRALAALRRTPLAAGVPEFVAKLEAEQSAYLLALPMTAASFVLLAHILKDSARQFYIIDTPLAQVYLGPLAAAAGNARLVPAAQLVQHNRERRARERVAYVTFPDHQTTATDTAWPVTFCGEKHLMPVVEPVLLFRGIRRLVTLDASAYGETGGFGLCVYPARPSGEKPSEADARDVLAWLALRVEELFRAAPEEVLSWELSYARARSRQAVGPLMRLKAVEGFLRAWHADGAGLSPELKDWAVAELQGAQAQLSQAPEPTQPASSTARKAPAAEAEGELHPSPLLRRMILRAPSACAWAFKLLADADYHLHSRANDQLRRNLALAFPDRSDSALRGVVKRHYRSGYQRVVGAIHISNTSPEERRRYLETHVELRGVEHYRAACESPDPLVFFTPHYGEYLIGCLRGVMELSRFKRVSIFYDPPEKNPVTSTYRRLIESLDCDVNVLYNDKSAVLKGLRALRGGNALALMPDVYEVNSGAMCVPFFGRLMVAMGGTAFFALKGKARLLPSYCYRRGASRFVLQVDEEIEVSGTGDFSEDLYRTTVNIFKSIERQLGDLPEHWVYWNSLRDRYRLAADIELPREPDSFPAQFAALRERFAGDRTWLADFLEAFAHKLEAAQAAPRPCDVSTHPLP